jgi:hypothetical protein
MSCTGAFLAGIVVPRDGGLAITLTEKLEDMVSVIFLPLVSHSGFRKMHKLMDDYPVFYTLWPFN